MAELKYGELASWDDADVAGSNYFMDLVEGDNQVRVLTKPYQFVVHWTKDQSGKSRKIRCAINNCPLCRQGIDTQTRWYIGVLDRKSAGPKILEISTQIFKGIRDYIKNPEWDERYTKSWGEIMAYDINVQRGPKGAQPLYTVMPSPKMRDLTEKETAEVEDFLDKVDINRYTSPSTPEEVAEKLGMSLEDFPKPTSSRTQSVSGGKDAINSVSDDDNYDFGDEIG
jgi:hypothetical protein